MRGGLIRVLEAEKPVEAIPEAAEAAPPEKTGVVVHFLDKPLDDVRDALKNGGGFTYKKGRWTGGQLTAELREMVVKAGGAINE